MASMKKESTHCKECGVEFDGTNKFRLRALCKPCGAIDQKRTSAKQLKPKEEYRANKYNEFMLVNRNKYYSALLAEVKGMSRENHKEWVANKFNEILQNKKLWEYIATQETFPRKSNYQKKKLASSKNLLENY
jgi:16S rRNA C967 or C1407 C5-methylase (RsmB/RsmF family)